MAHLVKKSGKEAFEVMKKELAGTDDLIDYDPLLSAHWMIMGRALEVGGLYMMGVDEKGEGYCPLCELNKNVPKETVMPGEIPATTWIQGCTESCLIFCQENGLVPVKA